MSKEKRNAFDEISDLLINQDVAPSNLMSVDIGANNFFELDFPQVTDTTDSDSKEPIVIPNSQNPQSPQDTPPTPSSEDTEDDIVTKVIEVEDEGEDYNDYNDLSIIALTRIKSGKWNLEEKDIPKDLDANTLLELFDAQEDSSIEKVREEVYSQAGEFANYLKYLMDGGNPEVVADAMDIKKMSLLDIEDSENQEQVITAYLELKGLDEDLIKSTLETILDKGKGKAEALKAQEQLKKYEENILETQTKELEEKKNLQAKQYNDYIKTFTDTVKKGKLGGVTVDDRKQKQIIDAFTKPTETIQITDPQSGKLVPKKITKSTALFNEVNSNPEKLASLLLWLLEGGNFEGIKEEIKNKKDDNLKEILKARKTVTVVNKPRNTNNAFEVLASRANSRY